MATREHFRIHPRLGWSEVLRLAEPFRVADVWCDGHESIFVILARLLDGRYALWAEAEWSRVKCIEVELIPDVEVALQKYDDLVRTVVAYANPAVDA